MTSTNYSNSLREAVPSVVKDIVSSVNPLKIILFGSVVRMEAGPDSDLDLLVVLDSLNPVERATLMGQIRGSINSIFPIDIFVTDQNELEQRKNIIGSIQYWPNREGEIVYERVV